MCENPIWILDSLMMTIQVTFLWNFVLIYVKETKQKINDNELDEDQ